MVRKGRQSGKMRREYNRRKHKKVIIGIGAAVIVLLLCFGLGWWLGNDKGMEITDVVTELRQEESQSTEGSNTERNIAAEQQTQETEAGNAEAEEKAIAGQQAKATESDSAEAEQLQTTERPQVKGIYVTGPMAGSASFDKLLKLLDETELNTIVLDVKNDAGEITWKMNMESAQELGACVAYIRDMESFMALLKEHEIYTIARIVCFKDPYLAAGRPELALKKPNGQPVTDANGLAWVNPYEEGVWEYLTDIAKAADDMGFDEIQFDYVRFPIGSDADAADYGVDMQTNTKQQAITGFLEYAMDELSDRDILVTADVFGTIIGSDTDVQRTGQDYVKLAETIDVLCPMVYPSHYGNHVFGLKVPDAQPYATVLAALTDSKEELSGIPREQQAIVRPWLQAFTASWVDGYISYGGEEIRQQIQAVYDAGYEEWILWNAANRYTADGLSEE